MPNLGANFYPKLVQISSELGMKPEDLLCVMVSESGLNPAAHEKVYNGGGLVGFMPDTLKGLKFPGGPEDFRKLSGEQQLDWVKKLVQGFMPMNGGPFTSAAQYYTANFLPIALKLPGIRQGDPNTIFIEEYPETIKDPKNGKSYSKKYYDIGIKVSPAAEKTWYKANPLFHGSVNGAITYGDMLKQVEKNKQNPLYQKAIMNMKNDTGYSPSSKNNHNVVMINKNNPTKSKNTTISVIEKTLNDFLEMIKAANMSYKKLYNTFLPINNILIKINSNNVNDAIEFSRILCLALNEELQARSFVFTEDNNVEIECSIAGPQLNCFGAVEELSKLVAQSFKLATSKLGGIDIKTNCFINKTSSYQPISLKCADINYRKFLLRFA